MRLNNLHYIFIILYCSLISCHDNVKHQPGETNQITLIFTAAPPPWSVYPETGGITPAREALDYVDDNLIPRIFVPDTLQNDTLRVKTKRKWVEFRHSYNAFDKLSYLFRNGDSVLITYRDIKPIVSVLNRKANVNEVNFELFKREALYPDDYPTFLKIQPAMFFKHDISPEILWNKYLLEFNKEKQYLDSLHQNRLISDTIYHFYKNQSFYQYKKAHLKSSIYRNRNNLIKKKLTKEDFYLHIPDKELVRIDYGNILDSRNDSLLYFGFYNDILDIIYYYCLPKVARLESTIYINGIAQGGGSHPDFLALYDSISKFSLTSPKANQLFKFRTIQQIIEYNTISEAEEAFVRFEKEVKDSALVNFVKEKYKIGDNNAKDDLQLVNNQGESLTFNQLLGKHKGKVIYMDFWNSHCPPCFKEFEYAGKLKNEFMGKDFVQVFISSEPNKKRWSSVSKKYHLDPESYFVENRYTSRQLESMNIQFVPHYVIFRKNGTQMKEAARPSDKAIFKLINKCLTE